MELKYYPYILTEQRISLMTDEEKMQYCFEHSDYCDWGAKERALMKAQFREAYGNVKQQYLNEMMESGEFANESEETLNDAATAMATFEAESMVCDLREIMHPIMLECGVSDEDYEKIMDCVRDDMFNDAVSLNENTVGPDMTWWAKGLSVTLIPLFTGMAYLLMLGKAQAAIASLKKYMNKLVEMIDDGINKPRSRWEKWKVSRLLAKAFGKDLKNTGQKDKASFREIEEQFEGNIACKAMVLMKNIGMLSDNFGDAIDELQNNKFDNGGYAMFQEKIAKPLSALTNKI